MLIVQSSHESMLRTQSAGIEFIPWGRKLLQGLAGVKTTRTPHSRTDGGASIELKVCSEETLSQVLLGWKKLWTAVSIDHSDHSDLC